MATAVQNVLDAVPGPTGPTVIVQERPGKSMKANLVTSRFFLKTRCGKQFSPWVMNGRDCYKACFRESVGYGARCSRCRDTQLERGQEEKEVVDSVYLGKSPRSLPTRITLHLRDYRQDLKLKKNCSTRSCEERCTSSCQGPHRK